MIPMAPLFCFDTFTATMCFLLILHIIAKIVFDEFVFSRTSYYAEWETWQFQIWKCNEGVNIFIWPFPDWPIILLLIKIHIVLWFWGSCLNYIHLTLSKMTHNSILNKNTYSSLILSQLPRELNLALFGVLPLCLLDCLFWHSGELAPNLIDTARWNHQCFAHLLMG